MRLRQKEYDMRVMGIEDTQLIVQLEKRHLHKAYKSETYSVFGIDIDWVYAAHYTERDSCPECHTAAQRNRQRNADQQPVTHYHEHAAADVDSVASEYVFFVQRTSRLAIG